MNKVFLVVGLSQAFSPCNHSRATLAEPPLPTAVYSPHFGNTRGHHVGQGGQGTTSTAARPGLPRCKQQQKQQQLQKGRKNQRNEYP